MFSPPGFLNKKVTGIEKERQETIKRNLVRLEAAGVSLDAIKALSKKVFLPPEGDENLSSCSDDDESSRPPPKKAKVATSSTLPIEATVNHGEGMSAMVAQPFELPNATNQHSSLPNVGGNIVVDALKQVMADQAKVVADQAKVVADQAKVVAAKVVADQAKVVADQAKVVADQAKVISDYSTNFEMRMLFMAEKFGVDSATIPRCIPSMKNGKDT